MAASNDRFRLQRPSGRSCAHRAFCILWVLAALCHPCSGDASPAYQNPILRDVADPFVLKYRGEYFLYRTAVRDALDVWTSRDLVHWRPGPTVWRPDSSGGPTGTNLWAPEVYNENGRFVLLFAAGSPAGDQRLWRAVADSPLGPFHTDPAAPLTGPWRIDVTLFRDDDGRRYLYCCHRLPPSLGFGARVEGQGLTLVQDSISALSSAPGSAGVPLEEAWAPMVTAGAPWEGVWVEGPTILKDTSGYYLLYSAPDAESPNYQVGYATAPHPLGPWTKRGLLIPTLPYTPGPGHQGVVLAPDNLTPYLVYHRKRLAERGWDRDLMLDRLSMGAGHLSTRAPTRTPQPLPPRPAFEAVFDRPLSPSLWTGTAGSWEAIPSSREVQQRDSTATARLRLASYSFRDAVIEVNLCRISGEGGLGLTLAGGPARLSIMLFPRGTRSIRIGAATTDLPPEVDPAVYHQLLLTRRGGDIQVRLDDRPVGTAPFNPRPAVLELATERCAAAFSAIAITPYTRPLPLGPPEATRSGWHRHGDQIEQRYLGLLPQLLPIAARLPEHGTLSVTLQGWALGTSLRIRKYGVQLSGMSGSDRIEAYLDPPNQVLATHGSVAGKDLPWQNSDLPLGFDYTEAHRLSIARSGPRWRFTVDGGTVQERGAALRGPLRAALATEDARVTFHSIRVTGGATGRP